VVVLARVVVVPVQVVVVLARVVVVVPVEVVVAVVTQEVGKRDSYVQKWSSRRVPTIARPQVASKALASAGALLRADFPPACG